MSKDWKLLTKWGIPCLNGLYPWLGSPDTQFCGHCLPLPLRQGSWGLSPWSSPSTRPIFWTTVLRTSRRHSRKITLFRCLEFAEISVLKIEVISQLYHPSFRRHSHIIPSMCLWMCKSSGPQLSLTASAGLRFLYNKPWISDRCHRVAGCCR